MATSNSTSESVHDSTAQRLSAAVLRFIDNSFDAKAVVDFLDEATTGEMFLFGGTIRRMWLGEPMTGDLDIMVPNADSRAFDALDDLGVPFVLNSQKLRRYSWNRVQVDLFEPRQFFGGFEDVEAALRFFDLRINALALHWRTKQILDPFNVLSGVTPASPGINWTSWNAVPRNHVVVLAIRLAKVMSELPYLRIERTDADRLSREVLPLIRASAWEPVLYRFPKGKDEFIRTFETLVIGRVREDDHEGGRPYDRLLMAERRRPTRVKGRPLEEEADADRGRILFCAPFRRLQNKAQVFSLETNAAIRSRLTHSLEVSSIARLVAEQAMRALGPVALATLGIADKERALVTFVETACLIHDLGNPCFGHFGEIAIADWFHTNAPQLTPENLGADKRRLWDTYFSDFHYFDGNPQGFRISTTLQPTDTSDLFGLNLTATTLAATLKYPWPPVRVGGADRKKAGFFQTEADVAAWIQHSLQIKPECRHPLVYLVEAADDIAYCVSDIEDGIEKRLIAPSDFADFVGGHLADSGVWRETLSVADEDGGTNPNEATRTITNAKDVVKTLRALKDPKAGFSGGITSLEAFGGFRSAVIRFLAHRAGLAFRDKQTEILAGQAQPLLHDGLESELLGVLKKFASAYLYSSPVVLSREITAHAVIFGLLDAYCDLLTCDRRRFTAALDKKRRDPAGRPISRDASLLSRVSRKHLAVYLERVRLSDLAFASDGACADLLERIHRIHLIVDYITGMTDEFALQTFRLISGSEVSPYRS